MQSVPGVFLLESAEKKIKTSNQLLVQPSLQKLSITQ